MILFGLALWGADARADGTDTSPNTEQGNILLRAVDMWFNPPSNDIYVGHVGILGQWDGTNTSDKASAFSVYEQGAKAGGYQVISYFPFKASNVTMTQSTYKDFRTNNFLWGIAWNSPVWTYTGMFYATFTPQIRRTIRDKANDLKNKDQYWVLRPFTKSYVDPGTSTFRCDGEVEYVLEQAAVWPSTYSAQIGEGVWRNAIEPVITTPKGYATDGMTIAESGLGPVISNFSATAQGSGGFQVTATANDGPYGSGIKSAWVGYEVSASSFYILGSASYNNVDGSQDISIMISTNNAQSGTAKLRVFDRAGNESSQVIDIDTIPPPAGGGKSKSGDPLNKTTQCGNIWASDTASCIRSLSLTGPYSYSSDTFYFEPGTSTGTAGSFCGLYVGTYTVHATDCAGNQSSFDLYISSGQWALKIQMDSSSSDSQGVTEQQVCTEPLTFVTRGATDKCTLGNSADGCGCKGDPNCYCPMVNTTWAGGAMTGTNCCSVIGDMSCSFCGVESDVVKSSAMPPPIRSFSFSISNADTFSVGPQIRAKAALGGLGGIEVESISEATLDPSHTLHGTVTVPEFNCSTVSAAIPGSTFTLTYPLQNVSISSTVVPALSTAAMQHQVLRLSSPHMYTIQWAGGAAVFNTTVTLKFEYPDTMSADTTTLHIYRYSSPLQLWEYGSVSNQTVTKNATTGIITAIGWSTRTGTYATFLPGQDSLAPYSTFFIQGSSFVFDSTLFASTDSLVVLTATDTAVSGFASGVATTYYRLDASPFDAWSVYSDSIPVPFGAHVLEYKSRDWAGNEGAVKKSTFVITTLPAARFSNGLVTADNALLGYSPSQGTKFEAQAGSVSNYMLKVSSPDGNTMMSTDFIGNIALGTQTATGRADIASDDIALQLRSGNSTGSVSSVQLAFGYDGGSSMRHAIRTQHNSSWTGNHMDFLIWTPATGSTAALAGMNVMTLETDSSTLQGLVHVHPSASRSRQEPLIVSDGTTEGMGVILASAWQTPSDKAVKHGIRYLGRQDEDKALEEITALKPSRFRYKGPGRPQPFVRGLIYEESPASIRTPDGALSLDERIANAELALKAAVARLEKLQKKLKKLQGDMP